MTSRTPTMRAALFHDGRFDVGEVVRPEPGAGEVLVAVHACGICGSDLHYYKGEAPGPPVCPGHEISGRVVGGASHLAVGTPVVVEPIWGCGVCPCCRAGEPNLCPTLEILGRGRPGGFADVVVVPATSVYPLPAGLDLEAAILAEPLAVAVHAVNLSRVDSGDDVLVLGGGAIGLLIAFVAADRGVRVTVSARHAHQREAALRLGARRAIDADGLRPVAGSLPGVIFETVGGRASTLGLALELLRPGGTIVTLGVFLRPLTLDPVAFLAKEARLVGSMMYSRTGHSTDFETALALLRDHRARLATLITHRVALGEVEQGFALASDKTSGAIKVAVQVDQKL